MRYSTQKHPSLLPTPIFSDGLILQEIARVGKQKNVLPKDLLNDLTGQIVRGVAFSHNKMPFGETIELLAFVK